MQRLGHSISHQGELVSSIHVVRVATVENVKMSLENQMLLTIGLTFVGICLIIFIAGVIVACRYQPEDQNLELRGTFQRYFLLKIFDKKLKLTIA